MAKHRPAKHISQLAQVTIWLPEQVRVEIEEARLDLRRQGQPVSASGLIEAAVLELLERKDVAAVMRRRGITARRSGG